MKVLVDSGSTKADWIILNAQQQQISITSLGLNPEVLTPEEFRFRVNELAQIREHKQRITELYFYGAGCGTPRAKAMVLTFFKDYFPNLEVLEVLEDTYAAVYATSRVGEPAIVCINGTGSNCSFYDGKHVHQRVESLGYIAMDDCSGSSFGRLLIKGYYLKSMPLDLRELFEKSYDLDPDVIKDHFYKRENPNAYLASFLPFLIKHKSHPYMRGLIQEQIQFFIDYYIKQHPEHRFAPVHFIGSVAYLLQDLFKEKLQQSQVLPGVFYQKPIDGLLEFHKTTAHGNSPNRSR